MQIDKKTLRNVFLGVISCIILYWILHETDRFRNAYGVVKSVLFPFIFGGTLAFILNAPMRTFEKLFKGVKSNSMRRLLAILLTFVAVLLVLTIVFLLLIPQLSDTVQSLIPRLKSFVAQSEKVIMDFLKANPELLQWLQKNTDLINFNWGALAEKAVGLLSDGLTAIVGSTFSAIGSIAGAVFDFVIAIVFAIYCLFQKETLARQGRKLVYAYLPEKVSDWIVRILRLTNSTFSNFLSGQCIEVCILGTLFAVTMAIFRMPYIPLVSVLVAVTAFIPVVGAWVGCVLGAFLIFVANPLQAVWFVIMFIVLQQIENNLIYPRVVGTSIGLSGMWVLVAVAVGGEMMGVAGMFLMIPIASVLHSLLREITNNVLVKKDIDPDKLKEHPPEIVNARTKKKKEAVKHNQETTDNKPE